MIVLCFSFFKFLVKVDCTVYRDLCAVHNIIGFPTLTLFSAGGSRHVRYKGRRDLESLKMFLQQNSDDTESETEDVKVWLLALMGM